MTETKQQGAAAKACGDWEWFWRIVAGLMLLLIAWIAWVLYQISPRPVVTQLAYEAQARRVEAKIEAAPAPQTLSAVVPALPTIPPSPEALAMEQVQAALRAGAHQASADVQAAALEPARASEEGLKLATEISTPPKDRGAPTPAAADPSAKPKP